MAPRPVGSFNPSTGNSGSWLSRVSENLRLALHPIAVRAVVVQAAPVHFDLVDLSARRGKAQTFSAGLHVVLLALLLFVAVSPPVHSPAHPGILISAGRDLLSYVPPLNPASIGDQASLGSDGGGGENDPRPPRFGNLAPHSSMPLVPPRLNREENALLPAPPAVLDPNAPTVVPLVTHLGLPWMTEDTDSAGPGTHHGFGYGDGGTMGDGNGPGTGDGTGNAPYANVVSPVMCLYCPDPGYTEEARKAKLQGKVLLRVLVGPDGKAQSIQILQGLGMGLDELAAQTIRSWRFSPGRDAAKRAVPTWVIVETRFQLF